MDQPEPDPSDPTDPAPIEDDTVDAEVDQGDGGSRPRGRAAGLSGLVGLLLGGAATYYVVRTLVDEWPAASEALEGADVRWVVAGGIAAALAMTSMGWGWRLVLRSVGVRAPVGRVVAWYFVGELGKYLPGGVWPVLGRGELARRGGVPRTRAYASVAMSLAVLYLAGLFVAAGFLPFAISGGGVNAWMLFLLALPVGIVLLHHDVLGWLVSRVTRATGREIDVEIPRWQESLLLVACYLPTWLLVGSGTWAVARALDPEASFSQVVFAAVLSWIAGFLAVPVPAGAGVREAVLAASSGLDPGVSAATAIVARLLFVAVDVVGAALSAPAASRKRGGATVGPLPHHEPEAAADPVAAPLEPGP